MHLDLHLDIFSGAGESPAGGPAAKGENLFEDSRVGSEEDSGTSSSSSTTTTTTGGFISFGILRKNENNPSPEFSGFPATTSSAGERGFVLDSSNNGQKWLNLSPETKKKSRRGPRSRSSPYRGVTFYRRTGRWESHIWDCGKQVYLGGFDTAHAAARAYDRAAIKFRGLEADINFETSDYVEDMKQTKNLTKGEFVQALRRQISNGKLAKPIPSVARDKVCEVADIYGISTMLGSSSGREQNLELSLGIACGASKTGKAESERDLTRNYMAMAAKCNPAAMVGIYPDVYTNHQRMFEKRVRFGTMLNGMNAASSGFSSSSYSTTSSRDPSSSLLLSLKAYTTSLVPSTTSNNVGPFTTQVEDSLYVPS